MTYIAVADVDASVGEAETAGGRIVQRPFDIEGVGRIAIIADPTGAIVGIMTPSASD
jgi:predicted enzyme related to lactoylglutathione lyase